MVFRYWLAGSLAGGIAGIVAGLMAGDAQQGFIVGILVGAITSLAGSRFFKGNDADFSSAFLVSAPIAGVFGGVFASAIGDAGIQSAFISSGVGGVSGFFIAMVLDVLTGARPTDFDE
jgi:uncharacterized membrane protein YeaQ/YmgE (transglycosylase-associated protein family)